MPDPTSDVCVLCGEAITDLTTAIQAAHGAVCLQCATEIARALPTAPAGEAPERQPMDRPICPRCGVGMRRSRASRLRFASLAALIFGLALCIPVFVSPQRLLAISQSVTGTADNPVWQEKAEASELATTSIRLGTLVVALIGLPFTMTGVVLLLRPRRIWLCLSCGHRWPRSE